MEYLWQAGGGAASNETHSSDTLTDRQCEEGEEEERYGSRVVTDKCRRERKVKWDVSQLIRPTANQMAGGDQWGQVS